jgi:PAS domain S-box-containing protein
MASPSPILSAADHEPLRGHDWSSTPLGPVESWPPRLRFAFDICMHSALATAIYWGPDRLLIHNKDWPVLVGSSAMLGLPAQFALGSLWEMVGPIAEQVASTGEGAFVSEQKLLLVRSGVEEETWWNCHLMPILGEDGRVAGILNQANEVTKTVKAERRLSFQVDLADRLRGLRDPEAVKAAAARMLGEYLGAARVGYAEIDEESGTVTVRADWTRDDGVASLAGQSGLIAAFGEEALAFLRAGEVLAIPDIRAMPLASSQLQVEWEALGVRALITVPLVREGALKALLYVHEPAARTWKRSEAAMARDVAERSWAAVELALAEQSLRESEDHYRHTVELNPQVAWTALPNGWLNRVAGRWKEWTGTDGLGDSWTGSIHPDDRERSLERWAHSVGTGDPYDVEHRIRRSNGSWRWVRSLAVPRHDSHGAIRLWYGTTEDINERKAAEERQQLLIHELNHRVKNNLATVQAIAFQTLKGDQAMAEARSRFEARLMALSRTHNLLTDQSWSGAPLDRIVRESTEPLAGEERCTASGDPLWLAPHAALALSLALHELATNAAKYGALSAEQGRVAIEWRMDEDHLLLEWKERGGPPVTPPERRGFGSRLIERGLESDLGGGAKLDFEPDGLRCTIRASLDSIRAAEAGLG